VSELTRITQCDDSDYLPFANARIKALRATGLRYGSQKFGVGSVQIVVRIAGDYSYVSIVGGPAAAAYTDVTPPHDDRISRGFRGATGWRGGQIPSEAGYDKLAFFVSPNSDEYLSVETATSPTETKLRIRGLGDFTEEYEYPKTVTNVTNPGGIVTSISAQHFAYPLAGFNCSRRVYAVLLRGYYEEGIRYTLDGFYSNEAGTITSPFPIGAATIFVGTEGRYEGSEGDTSVAVYRLEVTVVDGVVTRTVHATEVGLLSSNLRVERVTTFWIGGQSQISETRADNAGGGPYYGNMFRRDHFAIAANGDVFVVRSTSTTITNRSTITGSPGVFTSLPDIAGVYGHTICAVTADGVAHEALALMSQGKADYVSGVITSADAKHLYIYVGVHDAAEPLTGGLEGEFNEALNVYNVVKLDGVLTVTFDRTIPLGHVSHTISGVVGSTLRLDRHNSKLHGAAQEVGGYIWSDTHCLDVTSGLIYAIPNYQIHPQSSDNPVVNWPCRYFNRASYIHSNGRDAGYALLKFGDPGLLGDAGDTSPRIFDYSSTSGVWKTYRLQKKQEPENTEELEIVEVSSTNVPDVLTNSGGTQADWDSLDGTQYVF